MPARGVSAGVMDVRVSAAVLTDLDIDMFMPGDAADAIDRSWRPYRVTGLPAGPLADLQVYGSDLDGRWEGMSHTLGCQHRGTAARTGSPRTTR
jgi:hypothetical protein